MPGDDLKFGDVIEFEFGGFTCRAMVLATTGDEVRTDEGTTALGSTGHILVLGLVDDGDPTNGWHRAGKTAEVHGKDFRVIR